MALESIAAVHPAFTRLSLAIGSGLVAAGFTNRCGLARLPYTRPATGAVAAMVEARTSGGRPRLTRAGPSAGGAR